MKKLTLSIILLLLFFSPYYLFSQSPSVVLPVGHNGRIAAVDISPDGKYAVTGGEDQVVILWNLESGKIIKRFTGIPYSILSIDIDPTFKYIAVGTKSKLIWEGSGETAKSTLLFNIETGRKEYAFDGFPYECKAVKFSPDGKKLAAGSTEWLFEFDVESKELIKKFVAGKDNLLATEYVDCIEYTKGGKQIITNYTKGAAIWNATSYKREEKLKWHEYSVFNMELSNDNGFLVTIGTDRKAAIWDLRSKEVIGHIQGLNSSIINSASFSTDNKYLAVTIMGTENSSIEVYDLSNFSNVLKLNGKKGEFSAVSFIDNNQSLVSIGAIEFRKSTIQKFTFPQGKKVNSFGTDLKGEEWMTAKTFSNENAFVAGSSNGLLVKWNLETATPEFIHQNSQSMLSQVVIDSSHNTILAGFNDGMIFRYDSETGFELGVFGNNISRPVYRGVSGDERFAVTAGAGVSEFNPKGIASMAISPYDNTLITGTYTGEIKKTSLDDPSTVDYVQSGNTQEEQVYYSAYMKSYKGKTIRSLDVRPRSKDYGFSGYKQSGLADSKRTVDINHNNMFQQVNDVSGLVRFSPNENTALLTNNRAIYIYDLASQKLNKPFKGAEDCILDLQFSKDGSFFTVVGRSQELILYNASTMQKIYNTEAHGANITSVNFVANENYLVTSSRDYTCKVWDANSGKELASFYTFDDGEWLVSTKDGYYFASKGAAKKLQYSIGLDVYPFEQFDLKYNRPDIVLSRIGLADQKLIKAYHNAYKKRLSKLGFTEEMLKEDFQLPQLNIENFEHLPIEIDSPKMELNLEMKDNLFPLDRVNVWVNDVAVYGTNGISVKAQNKKEMTKQVEIPLARGKNKVQVSVLNQAGVESYKQTFDLTCLAGKSKPDLFLITIGDSEYKQSKYNLTYAAKDANDIAELFEESEFYTNVHTKTLTNKKVTHDNVLALKGFFENADINDHVIIFLAGHGVLSADLDYYLATYYMDFEHPEEYGVAYDELESLLDGIKPLHKTLILDACHSGEIDKEEMELAVAENTEESDVQFRAVNNTVKSKLGSHNTLELTKSLFTDLRKGTGATVISSAGGMEFAMESDDWQNGLFTFALLNGIKTGDADLNDDKEIWLSELQEYVGNEVIRMSYGLQQPTSRIENQTVDFRIW